VPSALFSDTVLVWRARALDLSPTDVAVLLPLGAFVVVTVGALRTAFRALR
jgi:hypothetical protein